MKVYFDYAASTPVDPLVERAMRPYFLEKFGNPGSLHAFGQEAMAAVDRAREAIARSIGAEFREIVFTGSATEANNLAIRGTVRSCAAPHPRVIVSSIEHESVLETARSLAREGVDVVYLPVDRNGLVAARALRAALTPETVLVSIIYVQNELGTIEPIAELASIVAGYRKHLGGAYPRFHTDAAQAFQFFDCGTDALGVDYMTFSGHKIYGPKGIGVLYVRGNGDAGGALGGIAPITTGGGQEFMLRSGTENVPLIVGLERAVALALRDREKGKKRIAALKDYFIKKLKARYPDAEVNVDASAGTSPHIVNIYFPRHDAAELLMKFDLAGLAVSAGSACGARSLEPSHVLLAAGYPEARARRSIRFSFGRPTRKGEIDRALKIIKMSV